MAALVDISLDMSDLGVLADDLLFLDAQTLLEMRVKAVNVVALTVKEKSVEQTTQELNLSRAYVAGRIRRDEAKGGAAKAYVRSQVRGTTLQRFGAGIIEKPVTWSNARITSMGKKFSPWSGWTKRTGDPSRGIAPDFKSDGVGVDVNRKGDKRIASAFVLPLKNGNGLGVFQRKGGALEHLYGPSVYQTFRRYVQTNEQAIQDNLRDEFTGLLDRKISEFKR